MFEGYRKFTLKEGVLHGIQKSWPSAVFEAECFGGDILDCPMETLEEHYQRHKVNYSLWHGCGVHSFKDVDGINREFGINAGDITAKVFHYGRVDEFERGYRSSHCRITELTYYHDGDEAYARHQAKWLETRYGVPCLVDKAPDPVPTEWEFQTFINGPIVYSGWFCNGGSISWQTSASGSSATTTSPSPSKSRSGSHRKRQRVNKKPYQSVNGAKWWEKELS